MTPLQTHSLTALIAALIAVAITYFILTDADPTPEPIDPETYRIEERMRLRAEQVRAEAVKDSLEAVESRISERPAQRAAVNKKWAQIAAERANVTDSAAGVELINRIEQWQP